MPGLLLAGGGAEERGHKRWRTWWAGAKDCTACTATGERRVGETRACGLQRSRLNFRASSSYHFHSAVLITSKLFPVCLSFFFFFPCKNYEVNELSIIARMRSKHQEAQ